MKNEKQELIDFMHWLIYTKKEINKGEYIPRIVDDYLKSINSEPCERKVDSNNEQTQEICVCAMPHRDSDNEVCMICGKLLYPE